MLSEVLNYLISNISFCVNWLFTLVINESPRITLGTFILACAFIGIVLYFIFGTDFFPGHIDMPDVSFKREYYPKHTYQPKHMKGSLAVRGSHVSAYNDGISTRISRNKHKY